jgi:hypothetical protein
MLSRGHNELEEWSCSGTMGDLVAVQMEATVLRSVRGLVGQYRACHCINVYFI